MSNVEAALAPSSKALADPPPLTGLSLALAGFMLALSNFIVVLDVTIANVSVPHIAGSLAVAPSEGTWVITSYSVAEAITVPLTGWLGSRFGAVRVFLVALIGFGCCSFLCGLAPNLSALILFRVLQGLFGGPIMPMSQALMLRVFPKDKASTAFALWSMTTVVAPIAGPILGGAISDNWTWPWIFFINLPVIALAATFSMRLLRNHETPKISARIDYNGLCLLVVWVAALQILLDKGQEEDWFSSPLIVTLAIVAVVGFAAFIIWELTEAHPIVDLSLFKNRSFTVGTIAQSLGFGAFFAQIVLIPLWLQTTLGYTATWAGYTTSFLGILAVVMSPVAAALIGKIDVRFAVAFGLCWLGGVSFLRTQWVTDISFFSVSLPQMLQGFGMPFFFIGTMTLALGRIPAEKTASAAGLLSFVRTLAGAFATSLATTAWENSAAKDRSELVGLLHPRAFVEQLSAMNFLPAQIRSVLESTVNAESQTLSANHVFLACMVVLLMSAAITWAAPKPDKAVDLTATH